MKRIYRSRRDKIIGGVAAGMADYLSLDAALVRLTWLLFVFMGGIGLPVYILAWIIIPEEPYPGAAREKGMVHPGNEGAANSRVVVKNSASGAISNGGLETNPSSEEGQEFYEAPGQTEAIPGVSESAAPSRDRTNQALGILLVVIGLAFLIRETIHWDIFRYVWPTILIFLGIYVLVADRRG